MRRITIALIALASATCGGSPTAPNSPAPAAQTVQTATLVGFSITSASLVTGATQQLIATATMSDGLSKDVTADAQWQQSANISIATVFSGFVTAKVAGTTSVTATYQSLKANGTITVTPDPVLKITAMYCFASSGPGVTPFVECSLVVNPGANPPSTQLTAWADLSAVNSSSHAQMQRATTTGQLEYFVDFHIPAGFPPGTISIPGTVTDAQGRTATAVATFTVLGSPQPSPAPSLF